MIQKVRPTRGDSDHLEDRLQIGRSIRSLGAHFTSWPENVDSHQEAEYTNATFSLLSDSFPCITGGDHIRDDKGEGSR